MPTLLGANTLSTGYEVANSLRFNSGDSAYLDRAASGSTSSNTTFTVSFWTKRANLGAKQVVFMHENATSHAHKFEINFRTDNKITIETYKDGYEYNVISAEQFTDPGAWSNFVVRVDTTQSTESDRYRIYANGTQLTLTEAGNGYPTQNFEFNLGTKILAVGRYQAASPSAYLDGYLTEVVYCDGQSLAPTSFGEFDSDSPTIWKPIDVSGLTFGNNGFYLDFEDSSNLGNDVSGNASDFTANNLAATDQSVDTCTNNYATMNPLDNAVSAGTFSEGNLKIAYSGSNGSGVPLTSTIAVTQGKWYFEVKLTSTNDTGNAVGITDINAHSNAAANRLGLSTYSYAINDSDGKIYNNNSGSSYGSSFAAGDIMGVYLDLDNNKLYISENGTLGSSTGHSITATSSLPNNQYFFAVGLNSSSGASTFECNFGGTQTYSISSAVSDDNGHGNFEYSPNITGDGAAKKFYALNTKNLAEFG